MNGSDSSLNFPPIFIIGAPRSGSTLVYQAMLDYFDFGYLSNLHCLFHGTPAFVEYLTRPSRWRKKNHYNSEYGRIEGWGAPSECGEFWYRFFRRRPQFVPIDAVTNTNLRRLRGAVRNIGYRVKKPILFKNLNCALRLEPTITALPEAVFLVICRDELDNAHSILKGRKDIYGSYEEWLGLEPPSVEELKEFPSYKQVVLQIRHIHLLIDKARDEFGVSKFHDVRFEEFCCDPRKSFQTIGDFLFSHEIPFTQGGEIPTSFQTKSKVSIDKKLYQKLKGYVNSDT